ncbi:LacI family DNA-binding transcriptional regulator [Microbacterium betulae]|uniref:LacI family DNA-binding transcriptional regulator n=1 Tax=Microbacterium betulae TaxID=2981139 RepID=A0AA97FJQ0_9MICO|nr:LacI family DNA-binding transcriptional regulator [Microbacterium sp. AB]WOF24238.1 LacI family DNA-binding transcriptional regulator [Microbacterium sp. AB]
MTTSETRTAPIVGRATIHDVALAAGVSVSTVSKVVNGRYGVSAKTSARVLGVVSELGYETSLIASSLRRGRTNVVGVLVAEFEPFALALLQGISEALQDSGYDLLAYAGSLSGTDDARHEGWERRSLSRLGGTLIDGAVIVTPTVDSATASVPVVAIDPHTGASGPAAIDVDSLDGALQATRHLIELGHRRIGHVRGRTDLESARLREEGYRRALGEAGIVVDPALVRDGGYRAAEATDAAGSLLDLEDRPTAIFAANDLSAIRTIEVAAGRGLRVPHDLSVVGFDDIPGAASHEPPLTTIRQPLHEMGATAVRLLLRKLDDEDDAPAEHVRLPASLVVRGSTARRG